MKDAILQTIDEGGVTLLALLVLGVLIYTVAFKIWSLLQSEKNPNWEPSEGASPRDLERSFTCYENERMASIARRLPFLGILISVAPLLGLLGTVAGMLITFSGMAGNIGAPMDTVSAGISKALVTTQAGLVIAIPGAFVLALLKRKFDAANLRLQQRRHHALATTYSLSPLAK